MASIAGFTPGPWIVHPAYRHTVTSSGGAHICVALCRTGGRADEENVANARLIAAAPDLLAACEQTLHYLTVLVDNDIIAATAQIAALRAAIAQAQP